MNNNRGAGLVTDIHIKEVQNRIEKIWLREDGIIQDFVLPTAEYTLEDAKQGLAAIDQVSNGKLRPMLVDLRNIKTMDRAARQEAAAFEGVTSSAILIGSALSRFIGNIIIKFTDNVSRVGLFTSEAEAIEWLKEFLE